MRKTLVQYDEMTQHCRLFATVYSTMYLGVEEGKGFREWIARVLAFCVSRGGNCCEKFSSDNN